ncbi:MAG: cysteine-rich CWC family protein [Ideonella sp.]|nr:cysteine-rich CWC family protein [Ideonella sp.]
MPRNGGDAGNAGAAPPVSRDRCPRCGAAFHCGRHDPEPCACGTVPLGAATLAVLRVRYDRCLCLPCLQALAREARDLP